MGAGRKGPGTFTVIYTAAVLGALGLLLVDPLVGLVLAMTVTMVLAVVGLVMAERAQGRYRAEVAARAAAKPWLEAEILADEAALVEARRARLAASMARPAAGAYADAMQFSVWQAQERAAMADAAPQRVMITHHEPIERAS